jgi:hypothetical protein
MWGVYFCVTVTAKRGRLLVISENKDNIRSLGQHMFLFVDASTPTLTCKLQAQSKGSECLAVLNCF